MVSQPPTSLDIRGCSVWNKFTLCEHEVNPVWTVVGEEMPLSRNPFFFQHRELILEKQGDFLENYFLKKMEEKCSSLASDDGWAKFECAIYFTYKLHVKCVFCCANVEGNLVLCPLPREAVQLSWKWRVSSCSIAAEVSEYYVGCAGTQ